MITRVRRTDPEQKKNSYCKEITTETVQRPISSWRKHLCILYRHQWFYLYETQENSFLSKEVIKLAITKLRHIKGSGGSDGLKRSIVYIMNPQKTEDGLLVGGNAGTMPEEVFQVMMDTKHEWDKTEGRQGYHFVISWKPGEVTMMEAWDMASEFCERYLGDTYDYVFTIHTDRDHLHAHILFNSVSRVDGYKYHYKKGDWEKYIQPVTDSVCKEHGLPVLEEQKTGRSLSSYAEVKAVKEGLPTLTGIVRADIDRMISCSDSFPVFLLNMQKLGYRIRSGKSLTYYPPAIPSWPDRP